MAYATGIDVSPSGLKNHLSWSGGLRHRHRCVALWAEESFELVRWLTPPAKIVSPSGLKNQLRAGRDSIHCCIPNSRILATIFAASSVL